MTINTGIGQTRGTMAHFSRRVALMSILGASAGLSLARVMIITA